MFPNTTPPAGFLLADGSSFDGNTYPELAAALGGTTLPDLRDQFLRGTGTSRMPLTTQGQSTALPTNPFTGGTDQTGSHSHTARAKIQSDAGTIYDELRTGTNGGGTWNDTRAWGDAAGDHVHVVAINGGGDAETRPANTAVVFMIRAA